MAYFEFDGNVPQTQLVRQLKSTLITAQDLAENIAAQNAEMTLAQMTSQFGVTGLTEVQWETTISDIVTALSGAAIANLTTKVGFTT